MKIYLLEILRLLQVQQESNPSSRHVTVATLEKHEKGGV